MDHRWRKKLSLHREQKKRYCNDAQNQPAPRGRLYDIREPDLLCRDDCILDRKVDHSSGFAAIQKAVGRGKPILQARSIIKILGRFVCPQLISASEEKPDTNSEHPDANRPLRCRSRRFTSFQQEKKSEAEHSGNDPAFPDHERNAPRQQPGNDLVDGIPDRLFHTD